MESVELFDEAYYPVKDEEGFHRLMESFQWKRRDYGSRHMPTEYPCLVRVEYEINPNGRGYPEIYCYYESQIRDFASKIQDLL